MNANARYPPPKSRQSVVVILCIAVGIWVFLCGFPKACRNKSNFCANTQHCHKQNNYITYLPRYIICLLCAVRFYYLAILRLLHYTHCKLTYFASTYRTWNRMYSTFVHSTLTGANDKDAANLVSLIETNLLSSSIFLFQNSVNSS